MGRIGFVFSGQGDQFPGMGKDLCEQYASARRVFEFCEELRPGTMKQCFEGTDDELKETANTQPCMFAQELAAAEVLASLDIYPEAVAGFSLGEVAAATYAGVFSLGDGFRLVTKRGELMQEAAEKYDTAMAAVLRLTEEQVREVCERHEGIYPVNFNCPGQISVSGLASEMPAFLSDVKASGGRAVPLRVKGAFHSPFMKDAAEAFGKALAQADIHEPKISLYSDVTAQPYGDAAELLSKQIESPVLWEKIVRNMIASGIDTFVEIGPGKTLINMIKKIDQEVRIFSVSELDALLSEINNA